MPAQIIEGKVWKFGDNINTDYIMPNWAHPKTPQEAATFCMRANRPEFAGQVKPGDIIVGGKNFGCGSSKPATTNFITLGIGGAITETCGRIFFRNSINLGFPIMLCPGIYEAFNEGDRLRLNFATGEITNLTTGRILKAAPLPEVAMKVLNAGGMIAMLKQEYGGNKKSG
jgi:3-isopropylmalate/(R)-2-methylmalate dehydratase small subunit